MTRSQLDADISRLCTHLMADLGAPEVKTEVLQMRPLKVRAGITVAEVDPQIVVATCTSEAMRNACLNAWPMGMMINCPPKSIGIAADDQHVIFDLIFYSVNLETEAHLQPKA